MQAQPTASACCLDHLTPCLAFSLPCLTAPGEVKRKVAIVGKGLTFDSGGYNLKAGAGSMIEMMKVRPGRCWRLAVAGSGYAGA